VGSGKRQVQVKIRVAICLLNGIPDRPAVGRAIMYIKFPPDVAKTAYFEIAEVKYLLTWINRDDMNEILRDKNRAQLVGYPEVFDDLNRVWPNPSDGVVVVFK